MNEIIEEWKPICGYEGLYEVSNMGQVKSLKFDKEKILKQGKMKNDYLFVNLYKDGIMKRFLVHRLVASAFIDNPNNYPTVNHNNEVKTDNRVSNLCWMDYSQQQIHGTCQKRRVAHTDYKVRTANTDYKSFQSKRVASTDYQAIGRKVAEKLSRQVYQYSLDGTLVGIWQSVSECGKNGFYQGNVSECCNGKRKQHKGFIWSYYPL